MLLLQNARKSTKGKPASPGSLPRQSRIPARTAAKTTHPSMQGALHLPTGLRFPTCSVDSRSASSGSRGLGSPQKWGLSLPDQPSRVGHHHPLVNCEDYDFPFFHSSLSVLLGQQRAWWLGRAGT